MITIEGQESGVQSSTSSLVGTMKRARAWKAYALGALVAAISGLLLAACTQDATSESEAPDSVGAAVTGSFSWKGITWKPTNGGMAGIAQGRPSNIFVDGNGYLHLKIVNNGGTWTAAEMFSATNLGFGTYQWQIQGPVDKFAPSVVLGLFPYGPAAGIGADGTNELDQEFALWGYPDGTNFGWTFYPASGTQKGANSFRFSLNGGNAVTSRMVWKSTSVTGSLLSGFQPVTSTTGLIKSWTYAPTNPTTNIPQKALPLGMNLWLFEAPPADGQNVEIVIRDFTFIPQ